MGDVASDRCYRLEFDPGGLRVVLGGNWALESGFPSTSDVSREIAALPAGARVTFEVAALDDWDTSLVTFVYTIAESAAAGGVTVDTSSLPEGVRRLVDLARAVPRTESQRLPGDDSVRGRVGDVAIHAWDTAADAVGFLGEVISSVGALVRARARFRRVDLMHALEATGVGALGIVALINFLIGAVLAFVGAIQLVQFGATIYVADLVAIGVTRELAPLMTGIVMCGRTGAAFAATLGTMTVNEEVDALRTMGLRPVDFLVLPRVLATSIMLPALVAYADLLGMLGGMFVGVALLDVGVREYAVHTQSALALRHVIIGLVKALAFGVVVALGGCYYGIRCGRSAAAVGAAATKAVVMGIVLVVVVDAVFTVLLHLLHL
jgi:phospholipid/cholesterol/gamma-HCH transport system permease protein